MVCGLWFSVKNFEEHRVSVSYKDLETQVLVAQRLKYLNDEEAQKILDKIDRVSRLLYGLMDSLKKGERPRTKETTNHKPKTENPTREA